MALFQSQAVAGAMRAVAASMAASASSIAKSADAQTERNGVMAFAGKVDADDVEAKEFFALKRKFHLQKARAGVETLSLVASAATFPSTGGNSAVGNENNDVNNNNNSKSRNNDNNIPDNADDDDEDCVGQICFLLHHSSAAPYLFHLCATRFVISDTWASLLLKSP
jgi:hypothetical protein